MISSDWIGQVRHKTPSCPISAHACDPADSPSLSIAKSPSLLASESNTDGPAMTPLVSTSEAALFDARVKRNGDTHYGRSAGKASPSIPLLKLTASLIHSRSNRRHRSTSDPTSFGMGEAQLVQAQSHRITSIDVHRVWGQDGALELIQ